MEYFAMIIIIVTSPTSNLCIIFGNIIVAAMLCASTNDTDLLEHIYTYSININKLSHEKCMFYKAWMDRWINHSRLALIVYVKLFISLQLPLSTESMQQYCNMHVMVALWNETDSANSLKQANMWEQKNLAGERVKKKLMKWILESNQKLARLCYIFVMIWLFFHHSFRSVGWTNNKLSSIEPFVALSMQYNNEKKRW